MNWRRTMRPLSVTKQTTSRCLWMRHRQNSRTAMLSRRAASVASPSMSQKKYMPTKVKTSCMNTENHLEFSNSSSMTPQFG